jgi:hypothetical protein
MSKCVLAVEDQEDLRAPRPPHQQKSTPLSSRYQSLR